MLFQDGHVSYQKQSTLPEGQRDAIYLNDAGKEAAGLDRDDTVWAAAKPRPAKSQWRISPSRNSQRLDRRTRDSPSVSDAVSITSASARFLCAVRPIVRK